MGQITDKGIKQETMILQRKQNSNLSLAEKTKKAYRDIETIS